MKKLTKYELSKVSKNLNRYFNLADDQDFEKGLVWYKNANDFCKEKSIEYELSSLKIASILSALSPNNRWSRNLIDTDTVLRAIKNNVAPENVKVSTFHVNKFKAFTIGKDLVEITRESRKTYSFVRNVGLLDPERVTIDVWHLRACFNKDMGQIGKIAYDQIERLTINKAKKLGLKGFEFQAIIWLSAQKKFQTK
jgi:hypothetical protein